MTKEMEVHRSTTPFWRTDGLKPRRLRSSKIWNDARFTAKHSDVFELKVDPPEHAWCSMPTVPGAATRSTGSSCSRREEQKSGDGPYAAGCSSQEEAVPAR